MINSLEVNEFLFNAARRQGEATTQLDRLEVTLEERDKASKAFFNAAGKLHDLTKLSEKLCKDTGGHKFKGMFCIRCQAHDMDYEDMDDFYDEVYGDSRELD